MILKGKITKDGKMAIQELEYHLGRNKQLWGKEIALIVEVDNGVPSDNQQRFYWKLVSECVEGMYNQGMDLDKDAMDVKLRTWFGQGKDLSEFDKVGMNRFMNRIIQFAAEDLQHPISL